MMMTTESSSSINRNRNSSRNVNSAALQRSLSFRDPNSNSLDSSSCHHRGSSSHYGRKQYSSRNLSSFSAGAVTSASSRLLNAHVLSQSIHNSKSNANLNTPMVSLTLTLSSRHLSTSRKGTKDDIALNTKDPLDYSIHHQRLSAINTFDTNVEFGCDGASSKPRRRNSLDNSFLSSSSEHYDSRSDNDCDHDNTDDKNKGASDTDSKNTENTKATKASIVVLDNSLFSSIPITKNHSASCSRCSVHSNNPQEAAGTDTIIDDANNCTDSNSKINSKTIKSMDSCQYSEDTDPVCDNSDSSSSNSSSSSFDSGFGNDQADCDIAHSKNKTVKNKDKTKTNLSFSNNMLSLLNASTADIKISTTVSSDVRIPKLKASKNLLLVPQDSDHTNSDRGDQTSIESLSFHNFLKEKEISEKNGTFDNDGLDSSSHHHRVLDSKKGYAMFNAGKVYGDESVLLSRSHYRKTFQDDDDDFDDEYDNMMNYSAAVIKNYTNNTNNTITTTNTKSNDDLDEDCHANSKKKGLATFKAAAQLIHLQTTTNKNNKIKQITGTGTIANPSKQQQLQLKKPLTQIDDVSSTCSSLGSFRQEVPLARGLPSQGTLKTNPSSLRNASSNNYRSRLDDSSEMTTTDTDFDNDNDDSFCCGNNEDVADSNYLLQDLGASMNLDDEEFYNHHVKPHIMKLGNDDHTCLDEDIEEQLIVETMLPPASMSSSNQPTTNYKNSKKSISREVTQASSSSMSPSKIAPKMGLMVANVHASQVASPRKDSASSLSEKGPVDSLTTSSPTTISTAFKMSSVSTTGIPKQLRSVLAAAIDDADDDDCSSSASSIVSSSSSSSSFAAADSFGASFCDAKDFDKANFQYLSDSGSLAGASAFIGTYMATDGDDVSATGSSYGSNTNGKVSIQRMNSTCMSIGEKGESDHDSDNEKAHRKGDTNITISKSSTNQGVVAVRESYNEMTFEPSSSDSESDGESDAESDGDSFCDAIGTDEANIDYLGDDGSLAFNSIASSDEFSAAGSSYCSRFARRNSTCMSIGEEGESDVDSQDCDGIYNYEHNHRQNARSIVANQKKSQLETIIGDCSLNDNLSSVIASLAAILTTASTTDTTPLTPIGEGLQMDYKDEITNGRADKEIPAILPPAPPSSPVKKSKLKTSKRRTSGDGKLSNADEIQQSDSRHSRSQTATATSSNLADVDTPKSGSRRPNNLRLNLTPLTHDYTLQSIESNNMLLDALSPVTSGLTRFNGSSSDSPNQGLKMSFEGPPPPSSISPFHASFASKTSNCISAMNLNPICSQAGDDIRPTSLPARTMLSSSSSSSSSSHSSAKMITYHPKLAHKPVQRDDVDNSFNHQNTLLGPGSIGKAQKSMKSKRSLMSRLVSSSSRKLSILTKMSSIRSTALKQAQKGMTKSNSKSNGELMFDESKSLDMTELYNKKESKQGSSKMTVVVENKKENKYASSNSGVEAPSSISPPQGEPARTHSSLEKTRVHGPFQSSTSSSAESTRKEMSKTVSIRQNDVGVTLPTAIFRKEGSILQDTASDISSINVQQSNTIVETSSIKKGFSTRKLLGRMASRRTQKMGISSTSSDQKVSKRGFFSRVGSINATTQSDVSDVPQRKNNEENSRFGFASIRRLEI